MTFLEILNDAYDRCGQDQAPTVPAPVSRRFKRFVNRWHRKILSAPGMDPLRRVIVSQTSVADQPTYGVALQTIRYITETATQRRLIRKTLGWYRDRFPDPARVSGTPCWYVPLGMARIHTRPSAACELFAVSTNTGDTQTIAVEAIRTGGYRRLLSVLLTGLTPVSLGAAITDVIDVEDVYLSTAAAGTVTLTQGSGGTELSRIPIGATVGRFFRYALVPTPTDAIAYTIDGIADVSDLVNDTDEPFPNADFHDLLVDGAVYEEWSTRGRGADAKTLRADIELRIRRLRCSLLEWSEDNPDRDVRTFDETIHEPVV